MFRRVLSYILTVAVLSSMISYNFLDQEVYSNNDPAMDNSADFIFNYDTWEIEAYLGNDNDLLIPEMIFGTPVHGIGNRAFKEDFNLRSVYMLNDIRWIGEKAFYDCSNLNTVALPSNLEVISKFAFERCVRLENLVLPEGLLSIGNYAFGDCDSLEVVNIPSSVNHIDDFAFGGGCLSLEAFIVEQNNKDYSSLEGVLFDKAQTYLISYPAAKIGSEYIVPATVNTINENAFYECSNLSKVYFHKDINSIGLHLFSDNTVTMVVHEDSVAHHYAVVSGYNYELIANANPVDFIQFSDPNFKDALITSGADKDSDGEITESEALQLTIADISDSGIVNIDGIEYFTNMTNLDISKNPISDFSKLSNLESLIFIDLSQTDITNLDVIAGIQSLEGLYINFNRIVDISPLRLLTSLSDLQASGNNIEDISSLSKLTNLNTLLIDSNNITDISAVSGLENLFMIDISDNNVNDISPLANLKKLDIILMHANNIVDLSPLQDLTRLGWLFAAGNKISDLSPLKDLVNLDSLYLDNNEIVLLDGIENLSKLTYLHIDDNKITTLEPLRNVNLVELYANRNNIQDISPLETHSNLNHLELTNNNIREISPISIQGGFFKCCDLSGNPLLSAIDINVHYDSSFSAFNSNGTLEDYEVWVYDGILADSPIFIDTVVQADSVMFSWPPAQNAISYEIYINGIIYSSATNHYTYLKDPGVTDIDYMVRSINGDGHPSLFSPMEQMTIFGPVPPVMQFQQGISFVDLVPYRIFSLDRSQLPQEVGNFTHISVVGSDFEWTQENIISALYDFGNGPFLPTYYDEITGHSVLIYQNHLVMLYNDLLQPLGYCIVDELPISTLSTPTNVQAYKVGSDITITWDEVPEATHYEVNLDGDITYTSSAACTYFNVVSAPFYDYQVRAHNDTESSLFSPVQTLIGDLPPIPPVPEFFDGIDIQDYQDFRTVKVDRTLLPDPLKGFVHMSIGGSNVAWTEQEIRDTIAATLALGYGYKIYDDVLGYDTSYYDYSIVVLYDGNHIPLGYYVFNDSGTVIKEFTGGVSVQYNDTEKTFFVDDSVLPIEMQGFTHMSIIGSEGEWVGPSVSAVLNDITTLGYGIQLYDHSSGYDTSYATAQLIVLLDDQKNPLGYYKHNESIHVPLKPLLNADTTLDSIELSWTLDPNDASEFCVMVNGTAYYTTEMSLSVPFEIGTSIYDCSVRAINQYGSSDFSDEISLIVSTTPRLTGGIEFTDYLHGRNIKVDRTVLPFDVVDFVYMSVTGSVNPWTRNTIDSTIKDVIDNGHGFQQYNDVLGFDTSYYDYTLIVLYGADKTPLAYFEIERVPDAPQMVDASKSNNILTISWDKVDGAIGYDVLLGGSSVRTTDSYMDFTVLPFPIYQYQVRVETDLGLSEYSDLQFYLDDNVLPQVDQFLTGLTSVDDLGLRTFYIDESSIPGHFNPFTKIALYGSSTPWDIDELWTLVKRDVKYASYDFYDPSFGAVTKEYNYTAIVLFGNDGVPIGYYIYKDPSVFDLERFNEGVSIEGDSQARSYFIDRSKLPESSKNFTHISVTGSPTAWTDNGIQSAIKGSVENGYGYQVYDEMLGYQSSFYKNTLIVLYKNKVPVGYTTIEYLDDLPLLPANINAVKNGSDVTITWDASPNASLYEVLLDGRLFVTDQTSAVFNGVEEQEKYEYRVKAINIAGTSMYSGPDMLFGDAPATPTVVVAGKSNSEVLIYWAEVPGATSYDVDLDGVIVNTPNLDYTFIVEQKESYVYSVRANNINGSSQYTIAQTLMGDPPAMPPFVFAEKLGSEVTISWAMVPGATNYNVVLDGVIENTDQLSYKFIVTEKESYTYSVNSNNANGSSPFLPEQILDGDSPFTPTGINAVKNASNITVSWDEVVGASNYNVNLDGVIMNTSDTSYTFNSVIEKESYTFSVQSVNKNGTSVYSIPQNLGGDAPITPSNINAVRNGSDITITWDAVPGATNYNVDLDGGVKNVTGTSITFIDTTEKESYGYKVQAINKNGQSVYSSIAYLAGNAPAVPVNIVADKNGSEITVTWDAVPGATNYNVDLNGLVLNTTELSLTFTNVTELESYIFSVQAINANGSSNYSLIQSLAGDAPFVPKNVKAVRNGNDITITWDAVSAATNYNVDLDGKKVNVIGNTYTYVGLDDQESYVFSVQSVNKNGQSTYSDKGTVVGMIPSVPVNVEAKKNNSEITITWDDVSLANSYKVKLDNEIVSVIGTSYTFTNVDEQESYMYSVQAINTNGSSAFSLLANLAGDKPAVPGNIIASKNGSVITISWDSVPGATGYKVDLDGEVVSVKETSITFENITEQESYEYAIQASNKNGVSDYSELATINGDTPVIPSNLKAVKNASEITITWDAVDGATSYKLDLEGEVVTVTEATYTFTNVVERETYLYSIQASNKNGSSQVSEIHTLAGDPPLGPLNVSAIKNGSTVTVTWDTVPGASSYNVSLDGDIRNTTKTSYTYVSVTEKETYEYSVQSSNKNGVSSYSTIQQLAGDTPQVPTNVDATKDVDSITVTWDTVDGATSYNVVLDGELVNVDGTVNSYTFENVVDSDTYKYKVSAKNKNGESAYSYEKELYVGIKMGLDGFNDQTITAFKKEVFNLEGILNSNSDIKKIHIYIEAEDGSETLIETKAINAKTFDLTMLEAMIIGESVLSTPGTYKVNIYIDIEIFGSDVSLLIANKMLINAIPDIENIPAKLIHYYEVACPVSVDIIDSEGNVVASVDETMPTEQVFEFGRLHWYENDGDIVKIIYLFDEGYDIQINGTGDGSMDLTLSVMSSDGNVQESETFTDIPISTETVIDAKDNGAGDTVLVIDNDGDGEEDKTMEAVKVIYPESIAFDADKITIRKGKTSLLEVSLTPGDITDDTITWSSSDETIVSVDALGNIKANYQGTATITAMTSNGLKASVEVTVKKDKKPVVVEPDFVVENNDPPSTWDLTSKEDEEIIEDEKIAEGAPLFNQTGYINGYTDGTFKPDNLITRSEIAAIFTRIIDLKLGTIVPTFSDVSADLWAFDEIRTLSSQGIILGCGDGTFKPNDHITRSELYSMMYRTLEYLDIELTEGEHKFTDVSDHWCKEEVAVLTNWGVKLFEQELVFNPNEEITRAEVVYLINQFISLESSDTLDLLFTDIDADYWASEEIQNAYMTD